MATGHQQAYFDDDAVLASSIELDPERLRDALPGGDGVRASTVEGVGLVVARRAGDFMHAVVSANGAYPIELTLLGEPSDELEDVGSRAFDLGFLADAPPGVATRLLDAALAGPVVFSEPDEERRADWIAWLSYALPGGASLTFSTAGDEHARVRVADEPDAIDASEPSDLTPSFYARVALELAMRGGLREAVAALDEPDGLTLAVNGGATDLISPHQLPLALQLITELVTSGRVREAARAAAALPTGRPSTSLAVREEIPLPEPIAVPEAEAIIEAEVLEEDEHDPFVIRGTEIISVPFEPEVDEPFVPQAGAVIPDDVVVSVPFDVEEPEAPAEEPLPDADAWSSLLAALKTESVAPDESLPMTPLDAFATALRGTLDDEDEVIVEEEVGMSLAELEESLKRKDEQ